MALAAWPGVVAAKTYEVNRTGDPVPGTCGPSHCTLREAVLAANARAGADTVLLRSGKRYDLEQPGTGEAAGLIGDLDVTDRLAVVTTKQSRATIDANGLDRVFDFAAARGSLTRLVVTGGSPAAFESGGGIQAIGAPLHLARTRIAGNQAQSSGGVLAFDGGSIVRSQITGNLAVTNNAGLNVFGASAEKPFLLDRTLVARNETPLGPGGIGGGDIVVKRSRVLRNRATGGSGFCGGLDLGGTSKIVDTRIAFNEAAGAGGGGVCTAGVGTHLDIRSSVIERNTAAGNGGGVLFTYSFGSIRNSTITRNVAAGDGGGIYATVAQPLAISASTISNNRSGGNGGGILAESSTELPLVNSTISGNQADGLGGGIWADNPMGGNPTGVTVEFSSIVRNAADVDVTGGADSGGGIAQGVDAAFALHGALIALNLGPFPDCNAGVDSLGRNLISDQNGCTGLDAPSDLTVANPKLAPLADNGGATRTVALKRGSRAIDAGGSDCPKRDQRGRKRPQGPRCDIGAFER